MPSDAKQPPIDWTRRTEPADLPEWMDEPCDYEELRSCLRDLNQVNRLTRGFRPTLAFLERIVEARSDTRPLRILDVGFGGGDMLHRIAHWSKAQDIPVALTGIDLNPFAARGAAERYGRDPIRWLCGDALAYQGETDVVLSSLLTHHLASDDVVRFLRWMDTTATQGWFINDLERSARSARLFAALATALRWHRFVKHDGPVSFARSFNMQDWQTLLAKAGVPASEAEVVRHFPGRLCVGRLR